MQKSSPSQEKVTSAGVPAKISASEYVESMITSPQFGPQVADWHYTPGRPSQWHPLPAYMPDTVAVMLRRLGLAQLYSHQIEALTVIAAGQSTVVATPTASGKTLIYNLPLFQAIVKDANARALYLFPLKALAQDQLKTFRHWSDMLDGATPQAAIYDGDTTAYQRRKIRQHPPNAVMTNPEMVHLALLPFHDRWGTFFRNLQFIVIDEVHTYRGMLGAHMAQLLRRLRRICDYYGASPTYICTSATLANPGQLTEQLIGVPVKTILESGAPQGGRHIVLIDPLQSTSTTAISLLKAALARQLRTIIYTQSRKMAELLAIWAQHSSGRWADRISVYRAGLMPEERRAIEERLKSGDLLAVVSTSALELGIDIGHLDICILVGYPGSMVSTWQRSGRVGRQGQEAALVLIAAENALDRYFIANPQAFRQGKAEKAVVNPFNRVALKAHLECAAAELPLACNDPWLASAEVKSALAQLESDGMVLRTADGASLHSQRRRPHRFVNLRGGGEKYRILDTAEGVDIGEMDGHRLFRETHLGAVYLHHGKTYLVQSLDVPRHIIHVRPVANLKYYTRVRATADVTILDVRERQTIGHSQVCSGMLEVIDHISGYDQVRSSDGKVLARLPLEVPPTRFETQALWWDAPDDICAFVSSRGFDVMGALHAAEHAAISIMPLLVSADRNDIGGMSTSFHPQVGAAAIFIYDGVPGGAGFSEEAYKKAAELLNHTQKAIQRCTCRTGCPGCVHSPKCGSGNHPIDKAGAVALLHQLRRPLAADHVRQTSLPVTAPLSQKTPGDPWQSRHYGVFDLETQLSAEEAGGWHQAHRMKISCGIVYDGEKNDFTVYTEERVEALIDHLKRFEQVIGFNSRRFDYKVLSGYSRFNFEKLPSLDLLEEVHRCLGFRRSLDHLAEATLGVRKNGSGLDALQWWQQGCMDKIIDYCRMDVCLTRDLYLFAREKGYLLFRANNGTKYRVPLGAFNRQR